MVCHHSGVTTLLSSEEFMIMVMVLVLVADRRLDHEPAGEQRSVLCE